QQYDTAIAGGAIQILLGCRRYDAGLQRGLHRQSPLPKRVVHVRPPNRGDGAGDLLRLGAGGWGPEQEARLTPSMLAARAGGWGLESEQELRLAPFMFVTLA